MRKLSVSHLPHGPIDGPSICQSSLSALLVVGQTFDLEQIERRVSERLPLATKKYGHHTGSNSGGRQ